MTPLAREISEQIALEGPISVERYMALCLAHPVHGYYMSQQPFGARGDFTTAPEISQMFGEMLGLWAVSLWHQMGRPTPLQLVEIGPGRGTLMADMLRAGRAMPGFIDAAAVTLVETSPALVQVQRATLRAHAVTWRREVSDVPPGPAIIIANELFDALPIRQYVHAGGAWRERQVGLGPEGLLFGLSEPVGDVANPAIAGKPPFDGAVRELSPAATVLIGSIAQRIASQGGALLAIDYGYATPDYGDSLQAMKAHAFVDPLHEPGLADITAHVDFSALATAAQRAGAVVHPLLTQRALLQRLGIEARAAALQHANPARAGDVAAALARLTGAAEGQMGTLFKALCISAALSAPPPAFDMPDPLIETITG